MRFAIVTEHGCRGFLLKRRDQIEAYDAEQHSLGTFAEEQAAVDAILNHATECST